VSELTLWIFRSVERSVAIYVLRAIKRTIKVQNASQIARVFVRYGSRGPPICDAEETAISVASMLYKVTEKDRVFLHRNVDIPE